ncbi:MAG: hypothetical protein CMO55_17755 [Verrucomicrobiales bacterium]|nr:hypothetical protein [Verrucomicrobiales bacterium]
MRLQLTDDASDRAEAARSLRTFGFTPARGFHPGLDVVQHAGGTGPGEIAFDLLDSVVEAIADGTGRRGFLDPHADRQRILLVKIFAALVEVDDIAVGGPAESPLGPGDTVLRLFVKEGTKRDLFDRSAGFTAPGTELRFAFSLASGCFHFLNLHLEVWYKVKLIKYHPEMRIGEVAERAGLNTQTIRFYEREGMLPAPARGSNGYREYKADTLTEIAFIRGCQNAGFTLKEIKWLKSLDTGADETCGKVRELLSQKRTVIEEKIESLKTIQTRLKAMEDRCAGLPAETACLVLSGKDL